MVTDDDFKNHWKRWGDLTRFYSCLIKASDEEIAKWKGQAEHYSNLIKGSGPLQNFRLSIETYLETLQQRELLLNGILIQYFSLFEMYCALVIDRYVQTGAEASEETKKYFSLDESDCLGESIVQYNKIEHYSPFIVRITKAALVAPCEKTDVLLKIAVIRNAVAHCGGVITKSMENRLKGNNITAYKHGDKIEMNIELLRDFLSSMKTFCRLCAANKRKVRTPTPIPLKKTNRPVKRSPNRNPLA